MWSSLAANGWFGNGLVFLASRRRMGMFFHVEIS